ncbi:dihydropteroate synthase, partial [Piscinibacter sp.]|uniref:dihydropteroate synthase n=1 Tax=Piscinibacter sp. TaxID=1903157 RepID=UPI0037833D7A
MIWQTTRFQVDLGQPRVMGIVNVTPDSFSDGGQHASTAAAIAAFAFGGRAAILDGNVKRVL